MKLRAIANAWRLVVAIGVAGALAVGCSATEVTPEARTPAEVHQLMVDADIACSDFEEKADDEVEPGTDQQATCDFDGESVTISTFKDRGQRDNGLRQVETLVCSTGLVQSYSYVAGDTWIIVPETETVSNQIGDAVGAGADTVNC